MKGTRYHYHKTKYHFKLIRSMKRSIALFAMTLLFRIIYPQGYLPSQNDIEAFFKTTTLVVLEDSPLSEYNTSIKEMMKQEWTITEYDFISVKEFEEKRKDPAF